MTDKLFITDEEIKIEGSEKFMEYLYKKEPYQYNILFKKYEELSIKYRINEKNFSRIKEILKEMMDEELVYFMFKSGKFMIYDANYRQYSFVNKQ